MTAPMAAISGITTDSIVVGGVVTRSVTDTAARVTWGKEYTQGM